MPAVVQTGKDAVVHSKYVCGMCSHTLINNYAADGGTWLLQRYPIDNHEPICEEFGCRNRVSMHIIAELLLEI